MSMLRSAAAAVRLIGKPASPLGAPTRVLIAALGPCATPHAGRRWLPTAAAAVHGSSKAHVSTYAGRRGLRLLDVHGSGAAVLPADTLPPPLLSAPTQEFSTSAGAEAGHIPAAGGNGAAAVVPSVVLVKVGDSGKYLPFSSEGLMGKNISDLLKVLKADEMFGSDLKDVKLSGCSVSVFKGKLAPGTDEPTAADEADASKFVELKGAKTVGIAAGRIGDGDQICIRVRLPASAPLFATAAEGLDGTSAEALLASVQRLVPPEYLKQGDALLVPRSLTSRVPQLSGLMLGNVMSSSTTLPDGFIDALESVRRSSIRAILAGFNARMLGRAAETVEGARIRLHNPLVALQSSPGGGKSTVLDCAALLCTHNVWHRFSSDATGASMCDALAASVPVTVTYNSGSDPDFLHADVDVGTGLALRILHSFFAPAMSFDAFARLLPTGRTVNANVTVQCCLAALAKDGRKHGILLLVDEVVKLGKSADGLLSVVGALLDNFSSHQFNAVCTTLNAKAFNDMETGSKRPIAWAPLPALPQQPVERMLCHALKLRSLPRAVRIAISDCAGHPRSQEFVLQAVETLRLARPSAWRRNGPLLLSGVRDMVTARLFQPGAWAVRAALEGRALSLDAPVQFAPDAGRQLLRDLIADGIFLNTDVDKVNKVVPKMSMMSLLASCRGGRLGNAVNQLAAVEEMALDGKPFGLGAQPFENFVANWLRLRLLLAAEFGSTLTVRDLLLGPLEHGHPTIGIALPEELKSATLCAPREVDVVRIPHKLAEYLDGKADCVLKSNVIYAFGDGNPGFDSLVLLNVSSGESSPGITQQHRRVAVSFESRYSNPTSVLADLSTKVEAKLRLWKQQAQLLSRKCGVAPEQCLFVYLAVRSVQLGDSERTATGLRAQLEKDNVLVLDRAAAGSLLTPTLADRAFFTLDLSPDAAAKAGKVSAHRV